MKAPLSWLKDYVDIDLGVEELASRLALTGTEVERVTAVGVPPEGDNLSRFVVGKVRECGRHPDADKLSVCQVDVGETELRTIVCGAPNVAAGQTVAVVLPGGVLPDGTRIKEAKLRGVTSAGMILSEAELGLAAKSAGIMVLPPEWGAGERLADHFALSDWVLEVEVTPNRPDCLSIRGLAREIAAISGAPFEEEVVYTFPWGTSTIDQDIAIEVQAPDLCPRYAARVIRGVTIAESPLWLKARLCHAGMRSICNVVDVTNYVLWALGQPLHAFDLRTIRGRRIVVRRARPGETLVTLDGELRVLTTDMLVIADAERASVVAGIMGGQESEVTESTTDVLLEGATFWGPSIMRTSAALGLRSEASTRYEKGLDPEMVPLALDMACSLLVELCGGEVSVGTIDVRSPAPPPRVVRLRSSRVAAVLGTSIPVAETKETLQRLGCRVRVAGEDLTVEPPTFRADLEREVDLIEEVARIHGLDRLPSTLPARRFGHGGLDPSQRYRRTVEDLLVGAGLTEVINYGFTDDRWPDRLRLAEDDPLRRAVRIANPLSVEQSMMRTLLLPGLLETARRNLSVREERVHVFEIGRVFLPAGPGLPREDLHCGLLCLGPWEPDTWLRSGVSVDYFLIKGILERLSRRLHVTLRYEPLASGGANGLPFLHPGRSALLVSEEGSTLGWLGEVHPLVLQAHELRGPAAAAEFDLEGLIALAAEVPLFRDLLAYPPVEQDLALVVDKSVPAADLLVAVREAAGPLLEEVRVFDLYEGAQIPAGKKSLALRLSFRSAERTLSEAEVNTLRAKMLDRLRERLGAELRS
jgi:phenylalanyl-tRNA synthetase beta chain